MTIHDLLQAAGLTANDEIPIWDADGTGEPTKKVTAQQLAAAVVALANLVTSVNNQTGAVSITPANIGAVAKSGDTMTGYLSVQNSIISVINTTKGDLAVVLIIDSNGNAGLYSPGYWNGNSFVATSKWLINRNTAGKVLVADHYNKDEVDEKVAQVDYKKHYTVQSSADLTISQLPQACLISTYGTVSNSLTMFSVVGYGATSARNKVTQITGNNEITVTPLDNAFGVVLHNGTAVAITVSVMDLS